MPWTAEEMAKKGAKKPAVAAEVANRVYRQCLQSGKGDKECAPMAIKVGLSVSNRGK